MSKQRDRVVETPGGGAALARLRYGGTVNGLPADGAEWCADVGLKKKIVGTSD